MARSHNATDLGHVISTHPGRILAGGWLVYVGLILAATAVHGAVTDSRFEMIGGGIPAALLLYVSVKRWNQSLVLCERGFVYRNGWHRHTVSWWDVVSARPARAANINRQNGMESHAEYRIEVETAAGLTLTLTDALRDVRSTERYFTAAAWQQHA
jgi:hypothetical protein